MHVCVCFHVLPELTRVFIYIFTISYNFLLSRSVTICVMQVRDASAKRHNIIARQCRHIFNMHAWHMMAMDVRCECFPEICVKDVCRDALVREVGWGQVRWVGEGGEWMMGDLIVNIWSVVCLARVIWFSEWHTVSCCFVTGPDFRPVLRVPLQAYRSFECLFT